MLKHLTPFMSRPSWTDHIETDRPTRRKQLGRQLGRHYSWHTIAYSDSTSAAQTNSDMPFLSDLGIVPTFNGHALLPGDFLLSAAMVLGLTVTRVRLDSGQLRVLGQPYLHPIIQAALPANNPNMVWYYKQPFRLPQREEIAVQRTNTTGVAERDTVILFLHKQYDPWPNGNIWIVRATSTTATVANAWTNIGQPTMETALPVGTYMLNWWDAQSTNGQALRWFFPLTSGLRPGLPMLTGIGNRNNYQIYEGVMGAAGPFVNDVLPFMEVLANGADNSFELRLAITRIAAGIGPMVPMGPLGLAGP